MCECCQFESCLRQLILSLGKNGVVLECVVALPLVLLTEVTCTCACASTLVVMATRVLR